METKTENKSKHTFSHGTHQFWVMSDENRVMGDGKQQIQTSPEYA